MIIRIGSKNIVCFIDLDLGSEILSKFSWPKSMKYNVLAGYCWIAQSGLQSNLEDWIVIDNPKSKLDFGFVIVNPVFSFHSNSNKVRIIFHKLTFHEA